jgi:hypothetical protein
MNGQKTARRGLVLVCACALSSAACGGTDDVVSAAAGGASGSAGSPLSGAAGSAGMNGGAQTAGIPLTWDDDGFVAPDNPFAIQGPFYSYSDCEPPSGLPCTAPDPSLSGTDAKPGWSASAAQVCLKGTAVKVENAMFAAQWGAGLALDLNSEGGEPGAPAIKGTFDLVRAGIRGFSVDISGTAPARIRINLTMPGVADSSFVDAQIPGTTTFDVADAKQGSWVTNKTPLDATKIEAIQFQVFTNATSATPFDFCVNAIRAISDTVTPAGG